MLLGIVVAVAVLTPATAYGDSPRNIVKKYIKALVDARWEDAASYWAPEAIAASERLGIRYTGTHAKYDCNSWIYMMLDSIRADRANYSVRKHGRHFDWAEVEVTIKPKYRYEIKIFGTTLDFGRTYSTIYYLVKRGGTYKIVSPFEILTRDWPRWESRYLRVHCEDSAKINEFSLSYVDHFIDSVATVLEIPPLRMTLLEREKIDYYLVPVEDVEKLTGVHAMGIALQSFNCIVTNFLAHTHEIAHILVDFAVEEAPRKTARFLSEGVAMTLGGGGHMSPAVALQRGVSWTKHDAANFDYVLPSDESFGGRRQFWLSYTAGAVFADCLIRSLGPRGFLDLYRRFSVCDSVPLEFDRVAVMDSLEAVMGMSYDRYVTDCRKESQKRYRYSGIRPRAQVPERTPDVESVTDEFTVRVWDTDSLYVFEIESTGPTPEGGFLFDCGDGGLVTDFESILFGRQFPDEEYQGECFGLLFSVKSVGLYNYRFDRVEALLMAGFHKDDVSIWHPFAQCLRFQVEQRLLPGHVMARLGAMLER